MSSSRNKNKSKHIPKEYEQQTAGAIDTIMLNLYELNSVADELIIGLNDRNRALTEDLADKKKYMHALHSSRLK